jgi:hypothetical protein
VGRKILTLVAALDIAIIVSGCGSSTTTTATTTTTAPAVPTAAEIKEEKAKEAAEKRAAAAEAKKEAREAATTKRAEAPKEHVEAAAKKQEEAEGHGLGASKARFDANNSVGEGPDPPEGAAWYHVLVTGAGDRVTAYNINVNFHPAEDARELMLLLAGNDLPRDSEIVTEHSRCIVWRSPLLLHLIGTEYAEAFVEPNVNNYAEMIAQTKPECS